MRKLLLILSLIIVCIYGCDKEKVEDEKTIYLYVGGQSNAGGGGCNKNEEGRKGSDLSSDENVLIYNQRANKWEQVDETGTLYNYPYRNFASADSLLAYQNFNGHNNWGYQLARMIAKKFNCKVRIIANTYGANKIERWITDGQRPNYDSLIAVCKRAGVQKFDYWTWHQGEANVDTLGHFSKLVKLRQQFINDNFIKADTPMAIGEIAVTRHPTMNKCFADFAASFKNVRVAKMKDLPTCDGTHFTNVSHDKAAELYYNCLFY